MRILCVISSSREEPFPTILKEGTLPSWARQAKQLEVVVLESHPTGKISLTVDKLREKLRYSNFWNSRIAQVLELLILAPFMFYVPRATPVEDLEGVKRLNIRIPEVLALYRWKYLSIMKYFIKNEEFDFLYTVNSSCYVDEATLIQHLTLVDSLDYAGSPIMDQKTGGFFASGANRVMSRNFVSEVLKMRVMWPSYVLEDMGLGRLATRLNFSLERLPTLNLSSEKEVNSLTEEEISTNFHYRLKSFTKDESGKMHRNDVKLFLSLTKKLRKS